MTTTQGTRAHGVQKGSTNAPRTRLYAHRPSRSVWIDVSGQVLGPRSVRAVCRATHRALAHVPPGVTRVGLNLTTLDRIPIELAVLLCREARLLGRRRLRLEAVLTGPETGPPGLERVLDCLPVVRPGDPDHVVLLQTLAAARELSAH